MTTMFQDDAARFATTAPAHERMQANIERTIADLRTSAVKLAVQEILRGDRACAEDVMRDCLEQQLNEAKIRVRHIEAVGS